jgi:hypothetical protein
MAWGWKLFFGPSLVAPVQSPPSRWQRGEQALARVAKVLHGLLGVPMTPGAVDVLEGMQCVPGAVLGRPHHPLENPAVKMQ